MEQQRLQRLTGDHHQRKEERLELVSLAELRYDEIQKASAQEATVGQGHLHQKKQVVRLVAHRVAQKAAAGGAGRREREELAITFGEFDCIRNNCLLIADKIASVIELRSFLLSIVHLNMSGEFEQLIG